MKNGGTTVYGQDGIIFRASNKLAGDLALIGHVELSSLFTSCMMYYRLLQNCIFGGRVRQHHANPVPEYLH